MKTMSGVKSLEKYFDILLATILAEVRLGLLFME